MSDAIRVRMSGREWGLMLLLSALWGGSFFFIGTAVRDMPVLTIVLLRVALAAAALWIVVLATGRRVPRGAATWGAFLVMGLLNNVIPFALIVRGQKQIPSGLASILNASTPLWTVLVAGALLSDERASVRKLAGVVMGLGGVAVMMGIDVIGGQHPLLPQLAVVCASISYGFSAWWGRRFRQIGVDPMVTAAGMLTASTLVLAIPVLALNGPPVGYPATSWAAVAAVVGAGLRHLFPHPRLRRGHQHLAGDVPRAGVGDPAGVAVSGRAAGVRAADRHGADRGGACADRRSAVCPARAAGAVAALSRRVTRTPRRSAGQGRQRPLAPGARARRWGRCRPSAGRTAMTSG